MATPKPQKTLAEREDAIIAKIFLVSLTPTSTKRDSTTVYLEMTAAVFLSEEKPLVLNIGMLERILVDRLSGEFTTESQFTYLVECYRRTCDELNKISSIKDQSLRKELEYVVHYAKKLAVSYSRIHLLSDSDTLAVSPILPLILSDVSSDFGGYGGGSSTRFLDEFFKEADYETLEPILNKLYEDLRASVIKVSVLGNFQQPLEALLRLCRIPACAKALVNHPSWIPKGPHVNGRVIEMTSILGAFFHVSSIRDHTMFNSEPDVGRQCLSVGSTLGIARKSLYDGLENVLLSLLRNKETRESVLDYLAQVINKNSSRAHLQVDPLASASSGFFINLSAVMLRLCEPFIDANLTKRDKIDPRYIILGTRLDLRELTTLNASSEEVAAWVHEEHPDYSHQSSAGNQKPEFSFICECFFMTARVLNLGLLKAFSEYKHIVQDLATSEDTLSMLRETQGQTPSRELELDIAQLEKEIELYSQEKLCYEAQVLKDVTLVRGAVEFYRLMIVWLADLVGGFKKPLPSSCPKLFACFPENFVEDAIELLLFASRVPGALDGFSLEDFLCFIVIFMASPNYVRNPYLRAKMVEVLNCWTPGKSYCSSTSLMLAGHPLLVEFLVRNLLKLYIEIEMTGSSTQFYDKFNIRHSIGNLLQYLWNIPDHRHAWIQIAKEEEKGIYLNFLNFLINDTIYLLEESLNKIQEIKGVEAELERSPAQERQRAAQQLHSQQNIINANMRMAMEDINMLEFMTEQITAPFLLPEMVERVANMLNYFLLQLAGPRQNSLNLKHNEKYEFHPKELLRKIVSIYVHLARGDRKNIFPAAISRDGRSYNELLFVDTADILRRINAESKVIQEFVELGAKVKAATSDAIDHEDALGEIPEEFLDPIQCTLMKDPVTLPSSNATVDRSVIQRHLLSNNSDPFNRSHLTEDMLRPNSDLKAKIQEFVRSQVLRRNMVLQGA